MLAAGKAYFGKGQTLYNISSPFVNMQQWHVPNVSLMAQNTSYFMIHTLFHP